VPLKKITTEFLSSEEFNLYTEEKRPLFIEGVSPSSYPLIIASIFKKCPKQTFVFVENSQKMNDLFLNLSCFIDDSKIFLLPPWETLPYEFTSIPESIEKQRIPSLFKILEKTEAIFISSIETLIRKIPKKEFLTKRGFQFQIDEEYPFEDLPEMFTNYGYSRESKVEAFGQFSVKGEIIDIFIPAKDNPIRLDFFDNSLESIREFDIESQLSINRLEEITINQKNEIILTINEKKIISDKIKNSIANGKKVPDFVIQDIKNNNYDNLSGINDLFPLVTEPSSLVDYFNEDRRIIFLDSIELSIKTNSLEKTFNQLYSKKYKETIALPPEYLIDPKSFQDIQDETIVIQSLTSRPDAISWNLKSIPNFQGKIKFLRKKKKKRLDDNWNIIVTTGFQGQARRLFDLLNSFNPNKDFHKIDESKKLNILILPLKEGIEINQTKRLIISDHEIFGKSYRKKREFKQKKSRPIDTFLDLKPGDYVVHINHGIGKFIKIERMSASGVERDFLMIEYANDDKLYVSLDQMPMVQKYIGLDGRKPRIDVLGKKSSWNKIKAKAREDVEKIAKELIEIYSKRNALKGYQFPPDTAWQEEFESFFEYEETPDQITAIEDVKDDMESSKPMDRLICGDVGFGKTEVAIRASFKAVMAGRQVAILVPTTILAMQHFSTFTKRFKDYPISIEMISRFKTAKEIKEIKENLPKGQIDIIIGTHALLSKDIKIKNLGLLIIDEEQRFGVKHKEQLKSIKTQVDVLILSATPIPRTLHMSMAGIRDLTIIETPPENRQSIETYVIEENPDILRNAILNEIDRDGQVFFVHNRVHSIDAIAAMLEELVPEATFAVAHGQMGENELEEIIIDFMNQRYDVLLSTTIIESGLDIPNVNTIIINRADTFGLSQLYQLKGRVGRSNKKAYAYLLYPKHIPLTEDAQKRLKVIAEYSKLGSGFKIAMKDLEIRGAGNILGKEQSGSIMEVGFDLYTQMLEDAVRKIKGEPPLNLFRTPIFLKTDFFIPDTYINDERQKIEFYKKFESCETDKEVEELTNELLDRFGKIPKEVSILVEFEKIRTIASKMRIDEILEDSKSIRIKLSKDTIINSGKLIDSISTDKRLSVDPNNPEILLLKPKSISIEKKFLELKKWLQQLT